MSRAYLALGCESAGTRLITKLITLAGVHGSYGHRQDFDYEIPVGYRSIVWRRSIPHGGNLAEGKNWPNLYEMRYKLEQKGYEDLTVVVVQRSTFPTVQSQVAYGHVHNEEEAIKNILKAQRMIYMFTQGIPTVTVSYEDLYSNTEKSIKALSFMLGLDIPVINIYNGNEKWYEGL